MTGNIKVEVLDLCFKQNSHLVLHYHHHCGIKSQYHHSCIQTIHSWSCPHQIFAFLLTSLSSFIPLSRPASSISLNTSHPFNVLFPTLSFCVTPDVPQVTHLHCSHSPLSADVLCHVWASYNTVLTATLSKQSSLCIDLEWCASKLHCLPPHTLRASLISTFTSVSQYPILHSQQHQEQGRPHSSASHNW